MGGGAFPDDTGMERDPNPPPPPPPPLPPSLLSSVGGGKEKEGKALPGLGPLAEGGGLPTLPPLDPPPDPPPVPARMVVALEGSLYLAFFPPLRLEREDMMSSS